MVGGGSRLGRSWALVKTEGELFIPLAKLHSLHAWAPLPQSPNTCSVGPTAPRCLCLCAQETALRVSALCDVLMLFQGALSLLRLGLRAAVVSGPAPFSRSSSRSSCCCCLLLAACCLHKRWGFCIAARPMGALLCAGCRWRPACPACPD